MDATPAIRAKFRLRGLAMPESFLYQYLVGGLVFAVGIYCGLRTGVFSWRDPEGRRRLFLTGQCYLVNN